MNEKNKKYLVGGWKMLDHIKFHSLGQRSALTNGDNVSLTNIQKCR
jgi:hypothetical protein